ncbi:hypothetical protein SAMN02799624_05280 [Paenibacillus sp. UNC496MF]|uniref:hypothetical protein n=1 Tax=Paenibacillus sp. UNC496MF TaxID=1502753 RepID=UPI0008E63864|nr:hypothetical protein [Paenibacillus sp. UNC496MF]SFJ63430.1 hypothetical protein SAMN02799624_05280 [Paenibacillus sp. UNC496MF]
MSDTWRLYDRDHRDFMYELMDTKVESIPLPLLGEIQLRPDIHDHIKINGEIYSVCILNLANNAAFVRRLDLSGNHDTEYKPNARCPHCGYEDIDCFEWSGDEGDRECGHCSLPFSYTREIIIEYSTEKKGPSNKPVRVEL